MRVMLDDDIARTIKIAARRSGKPVAEIVNETLRAGLAAAKIVRTARPYRMNPASLGGVLPGIDMDKALGLAAALESREFIRKNRASRTE